LAAVDHTLKPLLSPLLDETSKGVTTLSIPAELSQTFTNVLEQAFSGAQRRIRAVGRPAVAALVVAVDTEGWSWASFLQNGQAGRTPTITRDTSY
jgi:hypothetical protein